MGGPTLTRQSENGLFNAVGDPSDFTSLLRTIWRFGCISATLPVVTTLRI
jgi:hypothetical protein